MVAVIYSVPSEMFQVAKERVVSQRKQSHGDNSPREGITT